MAEHATEQSRAVQCMVLLLQHKYQCTAFHFAGLALEDIVYIWCISFIWRAAHAGYAWMAMNGRAWPLLSLVTLVCLCVHYPLGWSMKGTARLVAP